MTTRWAESAVEIITVGLPFCAFKVVTGLVALHTAFAPLGYALLALGCVDLALNALNLVALVAAHRRITGVCLTEIVLRDRHELGLALDVFLSFSLVAAVVGLGLIVRIPAWAMPIWNFAVVLNVFGAGLGRLFSAVRRPA